MGRTALTLLVAGVIAVLVGLVGTVAIAATAVKSSSEAVKIAEQHKTDLGAPAGYGAR